MALTEVVIEIYGLNMKSCLFRNVLTSLNVRLLSEETKSNIKFDFCCVYFLNLLISNYFILIE